MTSIPAASPKLGEKSFFSIGSVFAFSINSKASFVAFSSCCLPSKYCQPDQLIRPIPTKIQAYMMTFKNILTPFCIEEHLHKLMKFSYISSYHTFHYTSSKRFFNVGHFTIYLFILTLSPYWLCAFFTIQEDSFFHVYIALSSTYDRYPIYLFI